MQQQPTFSEFLLAFRHRGALMELSLVKVTWHLTTTERIVDTMKRLLCCFCGILLATSSLRATTLLSDTFDYPDGYLVGNGDWLQTGTTTTTPVQVSLGEVVLATGQDVNSPLSTGYTLVDGTPFFLGATINLQSATATGDYFLHWSPSGSSTIFMSRVFAKSSGTGYLLGYLETSGTGGTTTYGTTVLDFNENYRVVLQYNPVADAVNDTAELFVDGVSYLTDTWTSVTGEQPILGAVNLRQASGNAAYLHLDGLVLSTTFAEAMVPEPSAFALIGLGVAGLVAFRRRNS